MEWMFTQGNMASCMYVQFAIEWGSRICCHSTQKHTHTYSQMQETAVLSIMIIVKSAVYSKLRFDGLFFCFCKTWGHENAPQLAEAPSLRSRLHAKQFACCALLCSWFRYQVFLLLVAYLTLYCYSHTSENSGWSPKHEQNHCNCVTCHLQSTFGASRLWQ